MKAAGSLRWETRQQARWCSTRPISCARAGLERGDPLLQRRGLPRPAGQRVHHRGDVGRSRLQAAARVGQDPVGRGQLPGSPARRPRRRHHHLDPDRADDRGGRGRRQRERGGRRASATSASSAGTMEGQTSGGRPPGPRRQRRVQGRCPGPGRARRSPCPGCPSSPPLLRRPRSRIRARPKPPPCSPGRRCRVPSPITCWWTMTASFNRPVVDRKEWKPLSMELRGLEVGGYFWQVAAVDKDGTQGTFSETSRFVVSQGTPRRRPAASDPGSRMAPRGQHGPGEGTHGSRGGLERERRADRRAPRRQLQRVLDPRLRSTGGGPAGDGHGRRGRRAPARPSSCPTDARDGTPRGLLRQSRCAARSAKRGARPRLHLLRDARSPPRPRRLRRGPAGAGRGRPPAGSPRPAQGRGRAAGRRAPRAARRREARAGAPAPGLRLPRSRRGARATPGGRRARPPRGEPAQAPGRPDATWGSPSSGPPSASPSSPTS